MSKNFSLLKNKIFTSTLAKAAILGISSGLLIASLVALIYKLADGRINYLICILIGLAVMLISGGVFVIFNLPTEKRIAHYLDKKLDLNEKVQTMVAFKNDSGTIIGMQREEADKRLESNCKGIIITKRSWLNLIAPVLAIIMLIVAVAAPAKDTKKDINEQQQKPPEKIDITKTIIQELEDLIEYVEDSPMEPTPRELVLLQLNGLLEQIIDKEEIEVSEMKETVVSVINEVRIILDNANSGDDISHKLFSSESLEIKTLAYTISLLNYDLVNANLASMQIKLPDNATKREISDVCVLYGNAIKTALEEVGKFENDQLYATLSYMADKFLEINDSILDTSVTKIQEELKKLFSTVEGDIKSALRVQSDNSDVANTVVSTLMGIFGLSKADVPEYNDEHKITGAITPDTDEPNDDDKPQGDDGGYGSGEMEYAGKELVYDPETGELVEYGVLIDRYLAKVAAQLQDGKVPKELEDFINDYFAALYGGSNKE